VPDHQGRKEVLVAIEGDLKKAVKKRLWVLKRWAPFCNVVGNYNMVWDGVIYRQISHFYYT
jgi:hypothetical protein